MNKMSWRCSVCSAKVPWHDNKGEFVSSTLHNCEISELRLKVLTDWYPPSKKPLQDRTGSYLTCSNMRLSPVFIVLHWNGSGWMTVDQKTIVGYQHRHWCGLAFDPYECIMTPMRNIVLTNAQMEPA